MKPRIIDKPILTPGQRVDLQGHLLAVERFLMCGEVDESTPEFVALLDCWEGYHVPWNARPTVRCYRCFNGSWATGGAAEVVAAIKTHIERS